MISLSTLYWNWHMKRVNNVFKGKYKPIYSKKFNIWGVDLGNRVVIGELVYVLDEFTAGGVCYRCHSSFMNQYDAHVTHYYFDDVLRGLVNDPEGFSYHDYEEDYSPQERADLDAIQRRLLAEHKTNRWQDFAMPEQIPGVFLNLGDDSLTHTSAYRDFYAGFRQINPPFAWYRHDHILILPNPTPNQVR